MSKKILIVDDKKDTRDLCGLILRKEGFIVQTAESGKHALQQVAKEHPDMVMLDLMMPDMDGMEVFEIIKKDKKLKNTKVIFLTAVELTEEERDALLKMGAAACLLKPCSKHEILAAVKAASVE